MSIQQNMASDIYRMADSVHRSRDIAAFQQSLAQSIRNGAVESYVGIPVLQSLTQKLKLAQQKEAMAMAAPQGQQQQGVPIAAQVMQDAGQTDEDEQRYAGIDELRTNLPTEEDDQTVDDKYANGGIIAFAKEGQVRDTDPGAQGVQRTDSAIYERLAAEKETADAILINGLVRNPNPVGLKDRRSNPITTENSFVEPPPVTAAPPVVAAPPASTTGSASGVEVVEPARSGIDNLVAQPPTRLPDTSAAPATVERSMYGNMPLMSPEAKEAFSQYAQLYKDMRGDNKKAREEAKWMALMQAGFGMAGGTSPNALANINQGVQPAMAQYQSAIKDIRKEDREAVKGLIELGLTKEKFLQKSHELGINVYKANKVFEAAEVRARATVAAANVSAEGRNLAKTQTLYTSEGSALKGREQIVGKEIFGSTDYLRHQNTLASVKNLPNNPTNQAKIKEAQDYINAAKELYANKMTPYVNRFKSAHSALHGDEGINFNADQYLYPDGKPATPRVQFGNL